MISDIKWSARSTGTGSRVRIRIERQNKGFCTLQPQISLSFASATYIRRQKLHPQIGVLYTNDATSIEIFFFEEKMKELSILLILDREGREAILQLCGKRKLKRARVWEIIPNHFRATPHFSISASLRCRIYNISFALRENNVASLAEQSGL